MSLESAFLVALILGSASISFLAWCLLDTRKQVDKLTRDLDALTLRLDVHQGTVSPVTFHPPHEEVKAGKLSVNRASINAGFVKEATRLDKLKSLWGNASPDERAAFLAWVGC